MTYVFQVFNSDGTPFKMTPISRHFRILVEAASLEDAEVQAQTSLEEMFGADQGYYLEYVPDATR